MKNVVTMYITTVDKINKVLEYILGLFLAVMSASIFWQVFSRYVVGNSISWSEELARILMVYIVIIGSALALRRGQLLSVEVLPEVLQQKSRRMLKIIVNVVSLLFYAVLFTYGQTLAENVSGQTLPGLGISMYWFYIALSIGGFFLIINNIANILEGLREVSS